MRRSSFVYFCLLTFTAVLALVIGWRLPVEARDMMLGVLAGVAASIPTSLLVAWRAARALAAPRRSRQTWVREAPSWPGVIIDQAATPPAPGRSTNAGGSRCSLTHPTTWQD
ncbi:MAG: hypothetical protein IT318_05465 [Anaerolineales bacterium]|nr:hypothetical protein [Anaerolineales bacterium]